MKELELMKAETGVAGSFKFGGSSFKALDAEASAASAGSSHRLVAPTPTGTPPTTDPPAAADSPTTNPTGKKKKKKKKKKKRPQSTGSSGDVTGADTAVT